MTDRENGVTVNLREMMGMSWNGRATGTVPNAEVHPPPVNAKTMEPPDADTDSNILKKFLEPFIVFSN
jgi:hypothetical protein